GGHGGGRGRGGGGSRRGRGEARRGRRGRADGRRARRGPDRRRGRAARAPARAGRARGPRVRQALARGRRRRVRGDRLPRVLRARRGRARARAPAAAGAGRAQRAAPRPAWGDGRDLAVELPTRHSRGHDGGRAGDGQPGRAQARRAVPGLRAAASPYAGQRCSAAARVLVPEAAAELLLERLAGAVELLVTGPAEDLGSDVPPLIERAAQERVDGYAARAAADGEIVARGG